MDISFDPAKRAETLRNRGLDFADAGQVFLGQTATIQDLRFDYGEDRFITAGTLNGRYHPPETLPTGTHMRTKKTPSPAEWTDPDDAPPLTKEMLDQGEFFDGNRFVRKGRGRPKLASPKEQINIRLDPDVLARLRENGPGWQTRINEILRAALRLPEPPTTKTRC